MKKSILTIVMLLIAIILIGCSQECKEHVDNDFDGICDECKGELNTFKPTRKVKVIMPSGTPVLALGGLLNTNNEFEIVTDTTLLQTALTTNSVDIVICPLTMATNLYLKGKTTYKVEAILTTNNTYLISNNSLEPYSNLNGKHIVGFNEKNTPGVILKMFIAKENLTPTTQFEGNVNASVNAFTQGNAEYAVVSEPQLTSIKEKNPNLNVLNLGSLVSETFIPQAAIFVNAETRSDENVINFLNEVKKNIEYMNTLPNEYIDSVKNNHKYFSSIGAEVLKKSIPTSNVNYYKASEHKTEINAFYANVDLHASNFFGGKTPDENFYN